MSWWLDRSDAISQILTSNWQSFEASQEYNDSTRTTTKVIISTCIYNSVNWRFSRVWIISGNHSNGKLNERTVGENVLDDVNVTEDCSMVQRRQTELINL